MPDFKLNALHCKLPASRLNHTMGVLYGKVRMVFYSLDLRMYLRQASLDNGSANPSQLKRCFIHVWHFRMLQLVCVQNQQYQSDRWGLATCIKSTILRQMLRELLSEPNPLTNSNESEHEICFGGWVRTQGGTLICLFVCIFSQGVLCSKMMLACGIPTTNLSDP